MPRGSAGDGTPEFTQDARRAFADLDPLTRQVMRELGLFLVTVSMRA